MNIYGFQCTLKVPANPYTNYPILIVVSAADAQAAYDSFLVDYDTYNVLGLTKIEEIA
jgi:hypothetical protein